MMNSAGGAWDNAKKYAEASGQKGSAQHKACVVGDTVGDPFKDTSGPAINIQIKLMSYISVVMVPVFKRHLDYWWVALVIVGAVPLFVPIFHSFVPAEIQTEERLQQLKLPKEHHVASHVTDLRAAEMVLCGKLTEEDI